MRKLLPALLAIALLCALCACGGQSQPETVTSENPAAAEPAAPDPRPTEPAPQVAPDPTPETPAPLPEEPAAQEETPAVPQTEEPAPEKPAVKTPAQEKPPAEEPTPAEPEEDKPAETAPAKPAGDPKAIAQGLVGRPVSELYAAIGKPLASDYAPSCLIDGDDGELTYDGFVVYTERGEGYETVYAVM